MQNSGNLNSSIKKVSAKAAAIRASTGRSVGGGNIPGAENTKGSSSSATMRKSGGSQSTRKQAVTKYINKNNLIDSQQRKVVASNVNNSTIEGEGSHHNPLSQNSTFTTEGHPGHAVPT